MTLRPQTQCLAPSRNFGHDQIDTCNAYGDGSCEQMLGDLRAAERFGIATRFLPGNFRGHEPENLKRIFKESLARLKAGKYGDHTLHLGR